MTATLKIGVRAQCPPLTDNVCFWHLADIYLDAEHVRSWGWKRTSFARALRSANPP